MGLSTSCFLLWLVLAVTTSLQLASATCKVVKRGTSNDLLLLGTVLTTDGALHDSSVLIQGGRIAYVGDPCELAAERGDLASVVNCTGSAVISPGFINTHEHIEFSTVNPFEDIGELANHRHDWRVGARHHTMRPAAVNGSEADAIAWGELRHIFSGTTSIVGGKMAPGLARNLDFADGLEDGFPANTPAAIWDVFPLGDENGIMRNGDCNYGLYPVRRGTALRAHRYIAHVGEGVDAEAANEFSCLSSMDYDKSPEARKGGLSTDIIGPNVALVHALGLTAEDFDMVAQRRAKIVWSPRSNVFLYGNTLNVSHLLESITVALGTDWLPSGSATMGREAVCASSIMKESYGLSLKPKTLWEMATINAAKVAGFDNHVGSLEAGKLGDVVVFGTNTRSKSFDEDKIDPYGQAIFGAQEDIELVLRGGKILVASQELKTLTRGTCETVEFGKSGKTICVADDLGSSYRELEDSLKGVYPAVLPDIPPNEPTCKPTRQL
ncbi:metal dependent amidohydrolase [Xylariaceae sp. FL0255]|nr:metal dependent amidohydrolase [Xylariaceae sp. FL0255]